MSSFFIKSVLQCFSVAGLNIKVLGMFAFAEVVNGDRGIRFCFCWIGGTNMFQPYSFVLIEDPVVIGQDFIFKQVKRAFCFFVMALAAIAGNQTIGVFMMTVDFVVFDVGPCA